MERPARASSSQPLLIPAPKTASGGKNAARRFASGRITRNPAECLGKTHLRSRTLVGHPILAYTLAVLSELTRRQEKSLDFLRVWNAQAISPVLESTIAVVASRVNDDLLRPMQGISNISEWAKREACWTRMLEHMDEFADLLPEEFDGECLSRDDHLSEKRAARNTQKVDNGIEAQTKVFAIPGPKWIAIHDALVAKRMLTPKEIGVLKIAMQMPMKIPTDRQCAVLLDTIGKARAEGIAVD